MKEIFTIGHSNHSLERFIELLKSQNVSMICDVRSSPYSKYSPQFGKDAIGNVLANAGIGYVFMGRELGARRAELSCYDDNGKARYDCIAQLPVFQEGLQKVLQLTDTQVVALMCSEADPLTCHRTVLLCRELVRIEPDLMIKHVLGDGTTETHESVQRRLVNVHHLQKELFGELTSDAALINRAFDLQAEKLACGRETVET